MAIKTLFKKKYYKMHLVKILSRRPVKHKSIRKSTHIKENPLINIKNITKNYKPKNIARALRINISSAKKTFNQRKG